MQNKLQLEDLVPTEDNPNPPTRFELENERLANMFEAWVYNRRPDINSTTPRQQRAAWVMWLYMTGTKPPDDFIINLANSDSQPCYDEDQPCPQGFFEWLLEIGGQNVEN